MCFLGDFFQLETIDKDVIYNRSMEYIEQSTVLWELKGTHRYKRSAADHA
jgi:hypothetical protein